MKENKQPSNPQRAQTCLAGWVSLSLACYSPVQYSHHTPAVNVLVLSDTSDILEGWAEFVQLYLDFFNW